VKQNELQGKRLVAAKTFKNLSYCKLVVEAGTAQKFPLNTRPEEIREDAHYSV
jgi:hypothetical protein